MAYGATPYILWGNLGFCDFWIPGNGVPYRPYRSTPRDKPVGDDCFRKSTKASSEPQSGSRPRRNRPRSLSSTGVNCEKTTRQNPFSHTKQSATCSDSRVAPVGFHIARAIATIPCIKIVIVGSSEVRCFRPLVLCGKPQLVGTLFLAQTAYFTGPAIHCMNPPPPPLVPSRRVTAMIN